MSISYNPYVTPIIKEIKFACAKLVCTSPSAETEPLEEEFYSL